MSEGRVTFSAVFPYVQESILHVSVAGSSLQREIEVSPALARSDRSATVVATVEFDEFTSRLIGHSFKL